MTCYGVRAAFLAVAALVVAGGRGEAGDGIAVADPESLNVSRWRLERIDRIVEEGIRRGEMPGAVVVIGYRGQIVFERAYGLRQVEPEPVPMTADSVFDLASITKPVATATSVLLLADEGRIDLDGPVAQWLPEFGREGKSAITVRDLLLHQGGLIADNSLRDYEPGNPEASWEKICGLSPLAERGSRFIYSDVGFIVLGKLVERVSGQSLDRFSKTRVFEPLGMRETMYLPDDVLCARAVPTEQRRGEWLKGEVHDPRSAALGGVAGHAGLFSTGRDLTRFACAVIAVANGEESPVLTAAMVENMTAAHRVPRGVRGLGWDKQSPYSSNRGDLLSESAIGHGGFTGTALWIDPEQQLSVVFLSSRLHPDGKGSVNTLAGRIATVAAAALPE